MLARFFIFIFVFFSQIEILHATINSKFIPLLVSLNLDGVDRSDFYLCYKDEHAKIWMLSRDLQDLGFPQSQQKSRVFKKKNYVLLDSYAGLEYQVDDHTLILTLQTPMDWHRAAMIKKIELNNIGLHPRQSGFFLNYDVSARYSGFNSNTSASALTEFGVFNYYGVGSSGFLLHDSSHLRNENRLIRLDSVWTLDEPEKISSWRFGDSITSGLIWNGAVRFAGIQYSTNFSTQPNLITFPQPTLSGEAVLPSSIDILVNGLQTAQQTVGRGPFYVTQIPVVTGAGELQLVTTDLLGRQQISSYTYYASPVLLKAGLSDYSFEAGQIRASYGTESYRYGRSLGVGTYRYGLTEQDTVGVHLEFLKEQQNIGFVNHYLIESFGVLSLGAALSRTSGQNNFIREDFKRGVGGLLNAGFRRQTHFLSYGVQTTVASHDYFQIGTFKDKAYPNFTLQAFIGVSTENSGSISAAFTRLNNAFNHVKLAPYEYLSPNADVLTLGYSRNLFHSLFFTISGIMDLQHPENKQLVASIVVPLDDGNKSLALGAEHQNHHNQTNVQLIKNLPFGNGYGYRLFATNGKNIPLTGEFNIQRNQGLFGARYANMYGKQHVEFNARGSVISFAHHLFLARYVDQGFALAEVSGLENIDIYYRNQLIGQTNKAGYLYIPDVLPYQSNEIKLNPDKLPINAQINNINQIVVPYRRSGVLAKFDVKLMQNILLTLHQQNNEPIPAGAEVYINGNSTAFPVGYYGQVFISSPLEKVLSGRAIWNNQMCQFKIYLKPMLNIIRKEFTVCYQ